MFGQALKLFMADAPKMKNRGASSVVSSSGKELDFHVPAAGRRFK
jgi:hypothetical protein